MPAHAPRLCLALLLLLSLAPAPLAQSGRRSPPPQPEKTTPPAETKPRPTPTPEPPAPVEPDDPDEEAVRVETNLVTVPFIVSGRGGSYVADLRQDELTISEDGVEQKVSFFAAVNEPFNVVLMMDLSASTTTEKLRLIQDAAVRFTEQLQPGDRVKVISFDDRISDLCDFTGDRDRLASAIRATRPGKGTRLYDAFDVAYRALGRLKGRKAVVMLTDGMDYYSNGRTFDDNRRAVEESDVIVYPVRFDTREETERLARAQAGGATTIDLGTILGGRLPGGIPGTVVINPRGGGTTTGGRRPTNDPRDPRDPTRPGGRPGDDPFPDTTSRRRDDPTNGDSISVMLDQLYRTADDYLDMMARVSGGRLLRADHMPALPAAFSQIADELRTQYSLGYYPTNNARDGKLRKIRLRTTRKNVSVRARPGYRARRA